MSVNKVILLGRLGQDPELKYMPSGNAVCQFSIATSESWKDKQTGQKQEKTEWHRIIVWGKLGELCNQYLAKGRQVFVEGKLQTRSWDDKSGVKKYTTEILANTVQFIGGPSEGAHDNNQRMNTNGNADDRSFPPPQDNSGPSGNQFDHREMQISQDSNFTADDIPF